MIKNIHMESFKCFKELTLPVAPLTLLTGFNAGGKSTTIQVLLLLAQSLRSAPFSQRIALNGPITQLGTASEVMKGDSRELILGVENSESKMEWILKAEERRTATALDITAVRVEDCNGSRHIDFPAPRGWYNDLPEDMLGLLDAIKSTVFISAVRSGLSPTYPSPEEVEPIHADVGSYGQFAPWWLAHLLDEEIDQARHHVDEEGTNLRRQISAWASDLFPGAEANAGFLDKTGLVRLELRRSISEDWRRPANIGYGLTYAFPILVSGLLAHHGQLVIIDSPEAHLHPRAQSNIARFLAKMVAAGVQVILESHSDHILNGLRLAVKDGILNPDQVAVHFFTGNEDEAPPVISSEIDAHGGMSDWPNGFFDQAENDLASLAGWD